jgi:hypothetical protein
MAPNSGPLPGIDIFFKNKLDFLSIVVICLYNLQRQDIAGTSVQRKKGFIPGIPDAPAKRPSDANQRPPPGGGAWVPWFA